MFLCLDLELCEILARKFQKYKSQKSLNLFKPQSKLTPSELFNTISARKFRKSLILSPNLVTKKVIYVFSFRLRYKRSPKFLSLRKKKLLQAIPSRLIPSRIPQHL